MQPKRDLTCVTELEFSGTFTVSAACVLTGACEYGQADRTVSESESCKSELPLALSPETDILASLDNSCVTFWCSRSDPIQGICRNSIWGLIRLRLDVFFRQVHNPTNGSVPGTRFLNQHRINLTVIASIVTCG